MLDVAMPIHAEAVVDVASRCAPLIHPNTVVRLVQNESGRKALAIGINGGARLEHQPRTLGQAIATARVLRQQGYNFDAGLAQINVKNWTWLGLDEISVFDICTNLRAAQTVLLDCFDRAPSSDPQAALRQALSCFNTGNHRGGFANGYVSRVVSIPAFLPTVARKEPSR